MSQGNIIADFLLRESKKVRKDKRHILLIVVGKYCTYDYYLKHKLQRKCHYTVKDITEYIPRKICGHGMIINEVYYKSAFQAYYCQGKGESYDRIIISIDELQNYSEMFKKGRLNEIVDYCKNKGLNELWTYRHLLDEHEYFDELKKPRELTYEELKSSPDLDRLSRMLQLNKTATFEQRLSLVKDQVKKVIKRYPAQRPGLCPRRL